VRSDLEVHVVHKHGAPGVNTMARAMDDRGVIAENAKTDSHGVARVPCLEGLKYELEAGELHLRMPWRGNILKSSRTAFTCGEPSASLTIVLDRLAPW